MSSKSLFLLPLVALFIPTSASASGVDCHPDSKKLEWYLCVLKDVEYKRGMKTETRSECAINKKLDIKGCDLGDLGALLPAGEDPRTVYFYSVGPVDLDDSQWEVQEETEQSGCAVGVTRIESHHLTRFSDAFDKSNRERGEAHDEALKKKKQAIMPRGTLNLQGFPGVPCGGKKAAAGKMDAKTLSKFLFFTQTTFPEGWEP